MWITSLTELPWSQANDPPRAGVAQGKKGGSGFLEGLGFACLYDGARFLTLSRRGWVLSKVLSKNPVSGWLRGRFEFITSSYLLRRRLVADSLRSHLRRFWSRKPVWEQSYRGFESLPL